MYKLLLFLCCLSTVSFGQLGQVDFDLPYGAYEVGFKTADLKDTTRQFANFKTRDGISFRPVQACIWYPAAPKKGAQRMHIRDYFRSAYSPQQVLNFQAPADQLSQDDKKIIEAHFETSDTLIETMLSTECNAYYSAEAHLGPFPLVVYSPGANGPAFENHVLCEFLASQGFVVIAHKSYGSDAFLLTPDAQSLDDQFNDMEAIMHYGKSLPYVNPKLVTTIGHSWGGSANVLLAMKYPEVRGVVGLDGSVAYHYDTITKHPNFVAEGFATPFLFTRNNATAALSRRMGIDTAFTYYDSLDTRKKADLRFKAMRHTDFAAIMLQWLDTEIGGAQEVSKAKLTESYRWLCLYTYQFINHLSTNDYNSLTFLRYKPDRNGAPKNLIELSRPSGKW